MPKTKISEFSATPASNTDIDSINIAEGCAPSGINDAIRELMAQLKDFQTGAVGDSFNGPVGTTTAAAGAFTTLSASSTVSGTGFSTYLASPPAIGGTAAAAGSFTTLSASGAVTLSGGTANGVAYLNGSKVVTSGSVLTFNGSYLTANGLRLSGADTGNTIYQSTGNLFITADAGTLALQANSSNPIAFYLNSSEQMRLNTTGLGIGTSSPSGKLHVSGQTRIADSSSASNYILIGSGANAPRGGNSVMAQTGSMVMGTEAASNLLFITNATEAARLDSSGNLGLGVTPSAWASYRALSLGNIGSSIAGQTAANGTVFTSNAYYNAGWKYAATGVAAFFDAGNNVGGGFTWNQAPSGTAGNAITFTQAMTLDASGRLGVGTTSPSSYGGWISVDIRGSNGGQLIVANSAATNIGEIFTDSNGFNVSARTNNAMLFKTNDAERARIDSSGALLVNCTTVATNALFEVSSNGTKKSLQVYNNDNVQLYSLGTGTVYSNGGVLTNTNPSDERLKDEITNLSFGLQEILALRPVSYKWKNDRVSQGTQYGFIAQEVQPVMPDLVREFQTQDGEETVTRFGLEKEGIYATLVKAMQEQQAIIESLKARLDAANL